MDLESVAAYPSFPQQWMDDRTRTLAVQYLLQRKQPDLILVHLVDLDSEEHDQGPFGRNANAVLELTDELICQMPAALPPDYNFALASDTSTSPELEFLHLRPNQRNVGECATHSVRLASKLLRRND
jgi:predicted AlkP superfamily pyrophosphatase or phosphodiesterase